MMGKVEETFPDNPFWSLKGQPVRVHRVLVAKYLFPLLEWVPGYSLSLFKSDLVTGLTIEEESTSKREGKKKQTTLLGTQCGALLMQFKKSLEQSSTPSVKFQGSFLLQILDVHMPCNSSADEALMRSTYFWIAV